MMKTTTTTRIGLVMLRLVPFDVASVLVCFRLTLLDAGLVLVCWLDVGLVMVSVSAPAGGNVDYTLANVKLVEKEEMLRAPPTDDA